MFTGMTLVRQPALLEHDGDLPAVRRRPVIEINRLLRGTGGRLPGSRSSLRRLYARGRVFNALDFFVVDVAFPYATWTCWPWLLRVADVMRLDLSAGWAARTSQEPARQKATPIEGRDRRLVKTNTKRKYEGLRRRRSIAMRAVSKNSRASARSGPNVSTVARRRLDGPSAHPDPKNPLTRKAEVSSGRSDFGLADALYLQVEPEPPISRRYRNPLDDAAGSNAEACEDPGGLSGGDVTSSPSSPYASSSQSPSSPFFAFLAIGALLAMMGWRCRNSASANRKHCIPITTGRRKKTRLRLNERFTCCPQRVRWRKHAREIHRRVRAQRAECALALQKTLNRKNPHEIRVFCMHDLDKRTGSR